MAGNSIVVEREIRILRLIKYRLHSYLYVKPGGMEHVSFKQATLPRSKKE